MVANREAGRQLESKDGCRVHGNSQMQILVGFKPLDFAAARVHLRTSDRSNLRSVVLDDTTTYPETIVLEERRAREAARRSRRWTSARSRRSSTRSASSPASRSCHRSETGR